MLDNDRNFGNLLLQPENPELALLIKESKKILEDPEQVYDLAGKRLALRSLELHEHFTKPENTFHIAVVGNPNLGKTTYSYSLVKILKAYSFPAHYVDLDLYTLSGLAMAGETDSWKTTRSDVPEEEIRTSIQTFADSGPGIVVGDFPGRLDNPYHVNRLKVSDLALIFALNLKEKDKWVKLCEKADIGYRWAISRPSTSQDAPIFPQVVNLKRRVLFSTAMLTSATSVIEEAAEMTRAPSSDYEKYFSQPELVILKEYLDFLYSIQMP